MALRLALLIGCTALIPGCAPSGSGDVSVRWSVGLTGSCGGAGLDLVVARLETDDGVLVARQDEACEAGVARFTDVPVGGYRVRLLGVDDQAVEAYEAVVTGVTVQEGLEGGPYLGRLAPRDGRIGIAWYFQSGRLCSAYDVDTISIQLYAEDTELISREFSCARGDALLEDLRATAYDVRVDAIDGRGDVSHSFVLSGLKLRPGHRIDLEAPLVPCAGQCL
jgi:hypothetical protein